MNESTITVKIVISLKLITWEFSELFISSHHIIYKNENYRGVIDVWENVNEERKLYDLVKLTWELDNISLIHEPATFIFNVRGRGAVEKPGDSLKADTFVNDFDG